MADLRNALLTATVPIEGAAAPARFVLFGRTAAQIDAIRDRIAADFAAGLVVEERRTPVELVVAVPGRTIEDPEQAFAAAEAMAEDYDLVACEPDVVVHVMPDDPGRPGPTAEESAAAGLSSCWAPEEEDLKDRKTWAVAAIRATEAWAFATAQGRPSGGAGIVIAQPDTGLTLHRELADVPFRFPKNLLGDGRDDSDVTDRLEPFGNPGHGTGTSSVAVSRESFEITGSAPRAVLMPIRAVESVVRLSQVSVAKAIDHAVEHGAHVITMSLGGLWSYALWTAVSRAVAADVVVLAAAGNCVGTVVWPARFDECIAVAGVDSHDRPWRGTSKGPSVAIAAPAQNVYRAAAVADVVGQGQGTSFAVALMAGVAACWIAYHGRGRLVAEAKARDESLQALFRRLVRATARRPAGDWDEMNMGPGIVDAGALLKADLDLGRDTEAPTPPPRGARPQLSLERLVVEKTGALPVLPPAAMVRQGSRISMALLRPARPAGAASPPLAAPVVRRAVVGDGRQDAAHRSALDQRRIIAARQQAAEGRTESVADLESQTAPVLSKEQADAVLERVMALAASLPERERRDRPALLGALNTLARHAPMALAKLVGEGPLRGPLDTDEQAATEAIIIADGSRPSFLLQGGKAPLQHPFMGGWQPQLAAAEDAIARVAPAIGRIQPANGHLGNFIGTGALVDRAKGVILTNYHVLEDAQTQWGIRMHDRGGGVFKLLDPLEIDFLGEADSFDTNLFRIVSATVHPTSGRGLGRFDAVTMVIEARGSAGPLPEQVISFDPAATTLQAAASRTLCTIGFPGPPTAGESRSDIDWPFVIKTLFGNLFGLKRLAPGKVRQLPGMIELDPSRLSFSHEATTFGGASGSPVFAWESGMAACGLHFAGRTSSANYAVAPARAADALRAIGVPL